MTTLGQVLKLFRLSVAENFTAQKLAKEMGVSATYISEVENGKKTPSLESLKNFSKVFNVPLSQIFKIEEEANENNWSYEKTFLEVVKTYLKYNKEGD